MMQERKTNPYQVGNPVRNDRGFFGRAGVLNWVEETLAIPSTDALVLFGQRRIGKTSLLYKLDRILPKELYPSVYFDLQDQATRPLGAVLTDLADIIAQRLGLPDPTSETFDDEGRFFEKNFFPEALTHLSDGCRLVVLVDEFEALDGTGPRDLASGSAGLALYRFLHRLMRSQLPLVFIFSMGQRIDRLSESARKILKSAAHKEISSMSRTAATALVKQAENYGTLRFRKGSVERILELTQCHPYLTQLMCQTLWRRVHRSWEESGPPEVGVTEVEASIEEALETGDHSLAWMWSALTPAEEIYLSTLGEIATEGMAVTVDQVIEELDRHLPERRNREVEQAPHNLVNMKILREVGMDSHLFIIDLFRRWVHKRKTLRLVDDELAKSKPDADVLFAHAESVYRKKRWDRAGHLLWQVLDVNPYHLGARLLLGESLLLQGNTEKALEELEKAYQLNPRLARLAFARALEKRADEIKEMDSEGALRLCEQALELSPIEVRAQEIQAEIRGVEDEDT